MKGYDLNNVLFQRLFFRLKKHEHLLFLAYPRHLKRRACENEVKPQSIDRHCDWAE